MENIPRFSAKVSRSINEIGQAAWESAFPQIPESYGFLKTSEEALADQYKFYYISIYEGDSLLCVAPLFALEYPLDTTLDGAIKKVFDKFKKISPRFLTLRALACGSPACEGRLAVKGTRREEVVKTLVKEMFLIAKKERIPLVAFKEFSDEYNEILEPLLGMKFHKVRAMPSVELPIPFRSFDEYVASLSSATRIDLRRKFKKTEDRGLDLRMEERNELGELLDEAYNLYLNTLKKSGMTFEVITKDFFKNIPQNMPGKVKFFIWRIDGKMVAFHLCLVSGDVMIAEYLGFDYEAAYKYHLYFVVFRDEFNWCIRNGVRRYESGAMNYDPKKRLDFKFIPQYVYVKHRNRAINPLFSIITKLLKPENFDPVLKSVYAKK